MRRSVRRAWQALTGRHAGPESRGKTTAADDFAPAADLLTSLIDRIDDAVVVVDTDLTVVRWNGAMERLTGVERAAARGRSIRHLVPALDAVALPRCLRQAQTHELTFTAELPGPRSVDVRCMPLRDAAGQVTGAAALLVDTTDRDRRALVMGAMEAIGRSITSSLDLNEVLDTIVNKALEVTAADSALVVSWDGKSPEFRVMRAAGRLSERYSAAGAIPVGGGPISRAVLDNHPITTANILTDPRLWVTPERRAEIEREGFKGVAAAPLASKGSVHGALVVHSWVERQFSDEEVRTLALLAEQAAIAIDNARLYAEATQQARRLRELAEVEQLMAGSLELDDVLRRIAEATARLVGAPVAHLWTVERGTSMLRLRARSVDAALPRVEMPITLAFGEGITGAAAQSRVPVFVPDAREDPRVRLVAWVETAGLATILAVPILSGEELLGVLTVRARLGTLSADEDRALVTSLAARAALAMQNARAYADAVRRGARLRDLAAVSHSITASLDTADVMKRIAIAAAAMRPGALAAVHMYDADHDVLRFAGFSSYETRALPNERSASSGLPGLVFERRQPVLIPEPLAHPRTLAREWWSARPRATYYGVPIMVGDTFVGVIDYIPSDSVPDREEQEALRLLAAQAGIAIRNASLYQGERTQAERVGALAAINQRISSSLDLNELLRTIAESAASLTGVKEALFWLADEEHHTLSIRAGSSPSIAEDFPEPAVGYAFGGIGSIAREHRPLVIDDVFADERIIHHAWWRRWGISAFSGYPVLAGDTLLAVLALCHSEPIRFSEETRNVVDMFIAQASVAIQNARLYLEAQRRREVAEKLARVSREVTSTLDLERIADLVAAGVVELLNGRGSAVYRYEPEDGTLHPITSMGNVSMKGVVLQPGEGIAGRAVAERRIVMTPDILGEPEVKLSPELREHIAAQNYRSVVCVPLVARERVVGALAAVAEIGRTFSSDDLQVLRTFADQVSLAFENARLYASARDSLARLRETQAQLVQAGKMSALGQLVSGVAHELNNPLSVIIGYGQLLLNREASDALRRPLELMVQQGDRMAKIVRNLLYFARQRPPERAPVDLHQVIEQALTLRLNQLTLSSIAVERDFAPDLPPVPGDAQQLQQVFLNLVLNAEQAIAGVGRGGRMAFRTRVVDGGHTVRCEVTDDGPGIPSAVLPHIFEPFFTTKEVGVGTGLGLSVSYGIIEEHGGRLSAESRPGATAFTIELPVGAGTNLPRPVPLAVLPPFSADGRTALVVEDEQGVVDLMTMLLRDTGWRVDVVSGGRAALDHVRRSHYDLIVSDIRMPDGSGDDFYRQAVASDPTLTGRFIFVTGDTANVRAWDFLKQAMVPVIEKPFAPDRFLEVVRRVATALTGTGSRA